MSKNITGRLEKWEVRQINYSGKLYFFIAGHIYDDIRNRWGEGRFIHTSSITDSRSPEDFKEGDIITTKNSTYLLGKPL